MAQPSGQLALDSGHSSEYFWYAQGTGIWDAKNGAMLTKTGSAGMSTEGGANVALGNSATTYALASLVNTVSPWTIIIRVRASTGGSGYDGVACGEATGTSNFLWFRPDYNTYNFRVNGDTPSGSSTVTALATWAFTFSGTTLTAYKDGASVGTHSIASGSTLRLDTLLGGLSDGSLKLNGSFEFAHVIPSALTAGEVASRTSDPYAVLAAAGGTPSLVVSDGSHAHAADNLALTIIGTLSIADAAHAHAADSITLTATANGTITIPAVRDWGTKALKTGQTGVQVDIRNIATGALVVRKTGQTTHATTGVCVVADAAIVAGTTYEVVTRFADGSRGMWDYTAS